MIRANVEVAAITAIIGTAVPLLKALTATEAKAPMPICKVPNKEEAVPAFLSNGANASAAALG